jgi:RimJ/RimL family protein N-acetyltransferase
MQHCSTWESKTLSAGHRAYDDCEFIFDLVNEPSFKRYIGDKGVRTLDDAREYLRNGPIGSYENHGFGLYLVSRSSDETPLGICGLVKREEFDSPDLGFAFLERHWTNGYAYESSVAAIEHAGKQLGFKHILAMVDAENKSSRKLLEKLGFRFEKMARMPGGSEDICRYALELQV